MPPEVEAFHDWARARWEGYAADSPNPRYANMPLPIGNNGTSSMIECVQRGNSLVMDLIFASKADLIDLFDQPFVASVSFDNGGPVGRQTANAVKNNLFGRLHDEYPDL
jgi:hypothetical protein